MKSPNPTKNKPTNTKCWTGKIQKLQRFKTNPQPDGAQRRLAKNIRETCSTTPHAHRTKQMTQSIIGIQPRHHRHTPKNKGAHHTVHKKGRQTHPRNKSTLAHYRVLKQHQHAHQPEPNTIPAGKSGFVRSYTTNQPKVKLTLNPS